MLTSGPVVTGCVVISRGLVYIYIYIFMVMWYVRRLFAWIGINSAGFP